MTTAATATKVLAALEDGRVEAARRLLEPALEAAPNDQFLRGAMVALLISEHENDQATDIALALAAEKPTDPQVLECMLRGLSHTCRWQEVASTYERMIPTLTVASVRKSALENLLLAHARLHHHSDVQKAAAKLKTEVPTEPKYAVWGAMANLSAIALEDTTNIVLKVTAAVMDKLLVPTATYGPQHCMILTEAWERQGNLAAAIDFVGSVRCRVLSDEDRLEQLARFHTLPGGDIRVAAALYRRLWTKEPENWTYAMGFAEAVASALKQHSLDELRKEVTVTIAALPSVSGAQTVLGTAEASALDVAATLARAHSADKVPRGLQLARLELTQRAGLSTDVLVRDYVEVNALRPSCFLDVIKYVPSGDATWTNAFKVPNPSRANWALDDHARNCVRLQLLVATSPAVSTSDDVATALIKEIVASLCAPPTEVGDSAHPWPQYVVTACNVAARRYANCTDEASQQRWAEIGFRVTTLAPTGHKYPAVHLFAVLFCRALGTQSLADIDALDFKSVQHDSMAFLCLQPLLETRDLAAANVYASHAVQWYSTFERDTANLVSKAFHNIAWTQLRGLERFQQAINLSVARPEWYALRGLLEAFNAENIASLVTTLVHSRSLVPLLSLEADKAHVNDDRSSVASAALLTMPGSPDQTRLLAALMPEGPSAKDRLAVAQGLIAFLLCLHDAAAHSRWLQRPKAPASKKNKGAAAAPVVPAPTYYCNDAALNVMSRIDATQQSRVVAPIARFCSAFVHESADETRAATTAMTAFIDAFCKDVAEAPVTGGKLGALAWPTVPSVVTFLRVITPISSKHGNDIPAKAWAQKLVSTFGEAIQRLREAPFKCVATDEEVAALHLSVVDSNKGLQGVHTAVTSSIVATYTKAVVELSTIIAMK